jgi:hypothetical protein
MFDPYPNSYKGTFEASNFYGSFDLQYNIKTWAMETMKQ